MSFAKGLEVELKRSGAGVTQQPRRSLLLGGLPVSIRNAELRAGSIFEHSLEFGLSLLPFLDRVF
jgi:hypothetical protein